ncbi:MAG: glycine cleavage system aminomethyltransferase GcvT [Elusimicrobiota bacterium]|jgi:aminomethyltransferase|nr:glycine cleavage system aminomethyltransferase GcvT [Elusimicrobiota bacterium]
MEHIIRKTALYDACEKAGGKMVDFHGWLLPMQFEGIIAEHKAVREDAGMFDVSHMGQIFFEGPDAHKLLQTIATNNFKNTPGAGAYSHVLTEKGGVIDDIIAFCMTPQKFLVVVNSATKDKDYAWFAKVAKEGKFDAKVIDASDNYTMLALQGPKALDILTKLDADIKNLPRFNLKEAKILGGDVIITRTGYTGEEGCEIMGGADVINKLFDWALQNGFKPCGLGSRDILRFEAGYLLSGSDMDETRTPYEASFGWVVKMNKDIDFIGKPALLKQKEEGVKEKWQSFKLDGGIAREGALIYKDGKQIGKLTSGVFSPLFKAICAGYAPADLPEDSEVEIEIRGKMVPAKSVKTPFYKIL